MKKSFLAAFLLLSVGASAGAASRAGDQGVGVMVGNPSGFSYKMFLDERIGIDGAFGIDQSEPDAHLTLLFHDFNILKQSPAFKDVDGDLPLYFGVGPRALFADDTEFGIRFVAGVSYFPRAQPLEVFAELAPVLRITPDGGGDMDFAIGVRYYIPAIRPRE